jgi:hypothetical protein
VVAKKEATFKGEKAFEEVHAHTLTGIFGELELIRIK